MLRIPLPDGYETVIDDADALLVAGFPWRVLKAKNGPYVHAWNGRMHIYMHRLIAGADPKDHVDHHNRNGLDNRRANLRIATPSQNHANRLPERIAGKSSRFKGVFWDKARSRWMASIHLNGKTRSLGRFADEEVAARAYDRAALEAWGDFARLNFPVDNGIVCGLCDLGIIGAPCTCNPDVLDEWGRRACCGTLPDGGHAGTCQHSAMRGGPQELARLQEMWQRTQP